MQNSNLTHKFDVIVIGGGVVGAAILDRLARYRLSVLLLEADDDVAVGASRANSGIVHAGYDCMPGTLKAKFNKAGSEMYEKMCRELDVPYLKTHSIVVGNESQKSMIEVLKDRADKNGIATEIWGRDQILQLEKNVADSVKWALYAESAAVVSPYKFNIALADRGVLNGGQILLERRVEKVEKTANKIGDGRFCVHTVNDFEKGKKEQFVADVVINAAGAGADKINRMSGAEEYDVYYQKGEYFLLDQTERKNINTVIFPLPTALGKGVLAIPTADGNVLYGPTAEITENGDTTATAAGLEKIRQQLENIYKVPAYHKTIRLYAGLRTVSGDDFIVEESKKLDGFIYLLGICSPGLSSAPAIAEYVAETLVKSCFEGVKPLVLKNDVIVNLPRHEKMKEMSGEELHKKIETDKAWGRVVCRCEKVTEAEIVNAINSPLKAVTVDAVKRRVRAGMGRCQGGFCEPRVMTIIARETGIPFTAVRKGGVDSEIAITSIKTRIRTKDNEG